MNKKFLSAILFGALMVTSTGTFVSCKDYDDDIENLQGQISANTTAIAELKALIGDGNYVTSISVNGQNLVVNTKNGSTTVALPACEGGSLAEVKGGELFIDGEATGIKVAAGEAVKIEEGEWTILQADGTYKSTGIPASGVTVTGDEKEGWTLTITDAEGNVETVKLPSAASMLTNASLGTNKTLTVKYYDAWNIARPGNVITKAANWKGPKVLPNNGDVVYANEAEAIDLRIDPVNVDGTAFEYTFVTAKNASLSKVTMKASEYKEEDPKGRAAYGNGLYSLNLDHFIVAKDDNAKYQEHFAAHAGKKHAININGVYRTEYAAEITALAASSKSLKTLTINSVNANIGTTTTEIAGINVGTEYKVTFADAPALYDMFFDVDAEYVNEFGITWDNATRKFKVGKNPDASTIDSNFPLNIYTVDNTGKTQKTTVKIKLSAKLAGITMYDLYTHDVSAQYNQFDIELGTMRTALGAELDKWKINVASYDAKLYAELNSDGNDVKGAHISDVEEQVSSQSYLLASYTRNSANNGSSTLKDAGYLRVTVKNSVAAATNGGMKLDTKYYLKVTFKNSSEELNSIIVPVMFVAPTVADQIAVKDGFVKEDAINAYFYKTSGDLSVKKTIDVKKYFTYKSQISDAAIKFNDAKVVTYNWADWGTDDLVALSSGTTLEDAVVKFKDGTFVNDWGKELGYGQTLNLYVQKDNYAGWKYTVDGDNKYAFNMRIMSPIMEGSIVPVEGSTITISANDLVNGAKITDKMIMGYDYNGNAFDIVPDAYSTSATADQTWWEDPQIVLVTPSVDKKAYLKSATLAAATKDADGNVVKGAIVVKGESLSQTTEVLMPVTVKDCWAYYITKEVSVTVQVK